MKENLKKELNDLLEEYHSENVEAWDSSKQLRMDELLMYYYQSSENVYCKLEEMEE